MMNLIIHVCLNQIYPWRLVIIKFYCIIKHQRLLEIFVFCLSVPHFLFDWFHPSKIFLFLLDFSSGSFPPSFGFCWILNWTSDEVHSRRCSYRCLPPEGSTEQLLHPQLWLADLSWLNVWVFCCRCFSFCCQDNASKLLLALMESRHDNENAERILFNLRPRELVRAGSRFWPGSDPARSHAACLQVDVIKKAYQQESECEEEQVEVEVSPREVGHNIYILAQQVTTRSLLIGCWTPLMRFYCLFWYWVLIGSWRDTTKFCRTSWSRPRTARRARRASPPW